VGVDPEDPARPELAGEATERAEGDRVVAAEHEGSRLLADGSGDELRDAPARRLHRGEVADGLIAALDGLGDGRLDVAPVGRVDLQLVQPGLEARVADRRRAHVDAAPRLAEVEPRADDRDTRQ
jgi:hypothetical protein